MMRTPRTAFAPLSLVLALCLASMLPPGVAAAQSAPAPADGSRAAAAAPAAPTGEIAREATALQEAWDLLLDRFVDPLEATDLAEAANTAMLQALRDKGIEPAEGPLPAATGRSAVWAALAQRYRSLAAAYSALEPSALAYAAIAGMADVADDTHTHFMSPRQYQDHLAWTRGEVKYEGIGARLRGPSPTVVEIFGGSPAEAAGLRPGDRILQIGDTPAQDLRVEEAAALVRGAEGSAVTLLIQPAAGGPPRRFTITRREIQVPFVESRRVGDLGYVRLRGFPEPSVVDAVERAMLTLQGDGVQGLILDLRGNSGGRVDVGSRLLSRFVPSGPIYQEVDRRGRQAIRQVRAGSPILTVPFAVLVDEGTASMGEIFAVNVQEHQVGRIFGTTTMGSVAASQVLPLSDGSALQLSVMQIFSGQGQPLNRVGVRPDETVELSIEDLQSGRDAQLDRATAYLRDLARQPAAAGVGQ